ncbi:MAG: hypothetical protein ACOX5S_00055 [Patescibacteria group bacterium]|jgi:hypothetical protein
MGNKQAQNAICHGGQNHPRSRHPDESQDLRSLDINNDSESSSE